MCARHSLVSCDKRLAVVSPSSFHGLPKLLVDFFSSPLTKQSHPSVSGMPSLFSFESSFALKDVYISSGMVKGPAAVRGNIRGGFDFPRPAPLDPELRSLRSSSEKCAAKDIPSPSMSRSRLEKNSSSYQRSCGRDGFCEGCLSPNTSLAWYACELRMLRMRKLKPATSPSSHFVWRDSRRVRAGVLKRPKH